MAVIVSLLLLLLVVHQIPADSITDGTELIFASMIHRHGDRTPVTSTLSIVSPSIDIDAVEDLIAPWGYGQLTNTGRNRAYKTGEFIRRRYDELLSDTYNKSEIYIRSTDSTRTKMTVLTASAAVYPAVGDTWSADINWVPVPYTTVPALYDFNLYYINCPVYLTKYTSLMYSSSAAFDQYTELLTKLTDLIGFDLTAYPVLTYAVNDAFISLKNLGYELSSDVEALLPDLGIVAGDAAYVLLAQEDNLALQAGPLLNEFFEKAAAVIAGTDTQKVRVYSAHDVNVYAFEAITKVAKRQGVPRYAALYSLELRRVTETGKYVVLPVYLTTPEEPETYLQVEGCGDILCDYDTFYNITSPYLLTEDEWRTNCEFDPNLAIDTSDID